MGTGPKKLRRAQKINPHIESYPSNNPNQRNGHGQMVATYHREGILPIPSELERYEILCPGITDRLMASYEKQSNHRMTIESTVINGDSKRAYIGQIFAFILAMTAIIAGFTLIQNGKSAAGITSIISALATLLTAFFGSSFIRAIERKTKKDKVR